MRQVSRLAIGLLVFFLVSATPMPAQELAKRLILTDGTYQLATKWEIRGERVRYLSAERNEWEEVPKSMVDWAATDKYEKDRAAGKPAPEAVALDKELEAERQADEARSPHVAPGLRLPDDGGIILLDTFQTQPQLVELQQSSGELNRNMKGNILRATINPIAKNKQIIELPGLHAKIQAHVSVPAIYVNLDQQDQLDKVTQIAEKTKEEQLPWDRFRIVRLQNNNKDKRIVGDIKIAIYGKVTQEQKLVPTTATKLTLSTGVFERGLIGGMARWREMISVVAFIIAPRPTPSVIWAQAHTRLGGSHGQQYQKDSGGSSGCCTP